MLLPNREILLRSVNEEMIQPCPPEQISNGKLSLKSGRVKCCQRSG